MAFEFKDLIKLGSHPIVLAAAGGYVGHKKFGKKYGNWAAIGGSVAGAAAGFLINKYFLEAPKPTPAPQKQLPSRRSSQAQGDYVTLNTHAQDAPALPPHEEQPEFPEQVHEVRAEVGGIFEDNAFGSHQEVDQALSEILVDDDQLN